MGKFKITSWPIGGKVYLVKTQFPSTPLVEFSDGSLNECICPLNESARKECSRVQTSHIAEGCDDHLCVCKYSSDFKLYLLFGVKCTERNPFCRF